MQKLKLCFIACWYVVLYVSVVGAREVFVYYWRIEKLKFR
jgi:hypothetical protein